MSLWSHAGHDRAVIHLNGQFPPTDVKVAAHSNLDLDEIPFYVVD